MAPVFRTTTAAPTAPQTYVLQKNVFADALRALQAQSNQDTQAMVGPPSTQDAPVSLAQELKDKFNALPQGQKYAVMGVGVAAILGLVYIATK